MSRFAFFTLITNALVLPLLVNVQIKGLSDFPILFQGAFHDVTIDWYATVFNSLMISAFINAAYFGPSSHHRNVVQAVMAEPDGTLE